MASRFGGQLWLPILMFTGAVSAIVAEKVLSQQVGHLRPSEIEDQLQQCPLVQELNSYRQANAPQQSSFTAQIFEVLFPYGPAINALLATLYISGPPNFLLALCPPNIDPSSLSVMVAFAVGGLLGDTLFHLLPEIFLGEAAPDHARFVLVDNNKNILLGIAIMVGFLTFVAMDKSLRIATGGAGGHDHSHLEKKELEEQKAAKRPETPSATSTGAKTSPNGSVKGRKPKSQSGRLEVSSDTTALTLPSGSLKKLKGLEETKRANRWLEEVLEEDANHGVTQIAIWKAYEAAFKDAPAPLLEATVLIHGASRVFSNASAQIIDETDKKFIIKGVRPRGRAKETKVVEKPESQAIVSKTAAAPIITTKPEPSQSIKLSAYLNLIADFTHNITDGLALSSSFYASPTLGATTTMAVFFHEIPHEVGDFALLIQSGFSKRKAMGAQFITALGAFLGTCLGIAVQEFGKSDKGQDVVGSNNYKGLAGTGLGWEDMLLPFTAGTFLYVGTVAVIPDLLETGNNRNEEVSKTLLQLAACLTGAGIMFAISWA